MNLIASTNAEASWQSQAKVGAKKDVEKKQQPETQTIFQPELYS